jgi:predicted dehydrogenase
MPIQKKTTRRTFLQTSIATAGVASLPYHIGSGSAWAAARKEKPRYALIGVGGNGQRTLPQAATYVTPVAICDVDAPRLEERNQQLSEGKFDTYTDYRDVLARTDIDVVQISTPDHWHAKILIEAKLAGKDAYCEKPLTLTIDEGKLVRKIQKQTGRIVQVGTQQRSSFDKFNKALAIIADGRLGKLKKVSVHIDGGAWSPEIPIVDVPDGLDWDRWLGPGPKMEYRYSKKQQEKKTQFFTNGHTHFRWWYEHSGGKLTDWGAHHVDIAMLGIEAAGQSSDPVSVDGTAKHLVEFKDGVPQSNDRYNTANSFDLHVAFEGSDVDMNIRSDGDNGILFEGERGRIFVNRGKLVGKPVEDLADKPLAEDSISKIYRGMPMVDNNRGAHWANLIHCIDNNELPIANVHAHMKMLNVCHLAGICCRLGRKINWDQKTETIVGDDLAASMMKRPYREGFDIEM